MAFHFGPDKAGPSERQATIRGRDGHASDETTKGRGDEAMKRGGTGMGTWALAAGGGERARMPVKFRGDGARQRA